TLKGKTLSVEFASEGDLYARDFETITLMRSFTADAALDAVQNGEAAAALVDSVSAYLYLDAHPQSRLQISADSLIPDPYVIAVRRQDWRLHRDLNEALAAMQANNALDALLRAWLRVFPDSSSPETE